MKNAVNILVILQIVYTAVLIAVVTVSVIWGIKSGQFKKEKNASNLPLEIEVPDFDNQK